MTREAEIKMARKTLEKYEKAFDDTGEEMYSRLMDFWANVIKIKEEEGNGQARKEPGGTIS